jgi:hypothetical protein
MAGKPEGQSVKLQGILSSKGRRTTWERNNEPPPKAEPTQPATVHKPQPGPDGTIWCCGGRSSPAAHALHLKGQHVGTTCGDVTVAGLDDPWIAEADARLKAERAETAADDDAILRGEQVALYHEQQARPRRVARCVAGTSEWMGED